MRLLPLLLLVLACGDSTGAPDASGIDAGDEPSIDAGTEPDAGEPVDAGDEADAGDAPDAGDASDAGDGPDPCATPCNAPGGPDDCVCLANLHCGEAFRCSHDLECVCGPRGKGGFEAKCSTNDDCESGVCAEVTAFDGFCSKPCTGVTCDGKRLTVCEPFLDDLALCWFGD